MQTKQLFGGSVSIALMLSVLSCFAADEIGCPKEIYTSQQIEKEIEGWSGSRSSAKSLLKGVSFYLGHPDKRMSLKYDDVVEKGRREILKWRFDKRSSIWMECHYSNTHMTLIKPLRIGIRDCQAIYALTNLENIKCE